MQPGIDLLTSLYKYFAAPDKTDPVLDDYMLDYLKPLYANTLIRQQTPH